MACISRTNTYCCMACISRTNFSAAWLVFHVQFLRLYGLYFTYNTYCMACISHTQWLVLVFTASCPMACYSRKHMVLVINLYIKCACSRIVLPYAAVTVIVLVVNILVSFKYIYNKPGALGCISLSGLTERPLL